ncbi:MAG TPA: hypothetical protein PK890_00595 [Terrimesophilobacter sp.]|nr:hypothetical protein [Terrimesophilobacter sp.]
MNMPAGPRSGAVPAEEFPAKHARAPHSVTFPVKFDRQSQGEIEEVVAYLDADEVNDSNRVIDAYGRELRAFCA